MSSLEISRFKETLGHFATGVVVVTAKGPLGPVGFTCQTFGSLSLEPMLVSFAAKSQSTSWPQIRDAQHLCINILSFEQESVARTFAQSGADKFAGIGWTPGANGAPVLEGTLAHLEGTVADVMTHGDHDICVVAVSSIATSPGEPLLYFRGGFSKLA